METYIMIVMLCHFAPNGQEVCIPMTPSPQIYYKSKQSCNDASIIKREEMKKELAEWIRDNLEFDQLILEFYRDGEPDSGWIHVSWNSDNNRSQTLKALRNEDGKVEYKPW
jgi:hypothetical protein